MFPKQAFVALAVLLSLPFASPKVVFLHAAHEGSHGLCEALQHFCVNVDCSESHDGHVSTTIDWETVETSDAEVFLLRFGIRDDLSKLGQHKVIMLTREDLLRWSMAMFFFNHPKELRNRTITSRPKGPEYFNTTLLGTTMKRRVSEWERKAALLDRLDKAAWACSGTNAQSADCVDAPKYEFYVSTYENFLKDGFDYVDRLTATMGIGSDASESPRKTCTFREWTKPKHPSNQTLCDVATNCNDIDQWVGTQNFKTWGQLFDKYSDHMLH